MRKRFEPQIEIGQLLIEDTPTPKSRDGMAALVIGLRELHKNSVYRNRILDILEAKLITGKPRTGRPGMNLWPMFVLAQIRLSKRLNYDELHLHANYNKLVRQVMGVEREAGFEQITFPYQTIVDNVSLLDDESLKQINDVIVSFGQGEVFKKKEGEVLHLKTDSFVVESNVHFPIDYNLLWDCIRKCLDMIGKLEQKYGHITGWRKSNYWRSGLKSLMRQLGRACGSGGKNKEKRVKEVAASYLHQSGLLSVKIKQSLPTLPVYDVSDLATVILLEFYHSLMNKHIDLVDRRLLKGETIPQEEKMFSIFETYTEWITKGKLRPSVELGKKVNITTDQYHLIVDYQTMDHQSDSDIVIALADRLTPIFKIGSWSFDKGYWHPDNKALLEMVVPEVIMPKKGKCNQAEFDREHQRVYKKLRNKHSAVESNIYSLETRGLSRCPDRGKSHFTRYVAWAVCAYNLCCIGRKLQADYKREEQLLKRAA
jgi:hypothetical protein